jgi:import inner membrane translocase subunit TIM23
MGDDYPRRSLLGLGGYGAQDFNVPVTSGGSNPVISPYLNFDPALIAPSQDSFIFPEGLGSRQRGRFELAFSQIGGSVLCGGIGEFYNQAVVYIPFR